MRPMLLLPVVLAACAGLGPGNKGSEGLYRLPYDDGTRVRVSNDHRTHRPPNRLDLVGVGAPPQRIVAAADGIVRYIVDEFDARQDRTARQCYNNYVWLEHSNGEWTKYSHVRQHSVRRKANLREGNTVGAGTYLGDEGDVGCATGPHLHFEIAVPYNRNDPITPTGGFIKGRNLVPRICGVPAETLIAGTVHLAEQCGGVRSPNAADMSRWAASYDSTAKIRFIPIELWTGGEWDGTHEVRMTPANLSFGRRGEKRITGPLAWTRPGTAEAIQVYERNNKGKRQLFALSLALDASAESRRLWFAVIGPALVEE